MHLYENRRVKHARVIFLVGKLRWNTLCNFQTDEIIAFYFKKKKKSTNLSELTQVFFGLLSKYF